jgi:hypothetical protein
MPQWVIVERGADLGERRLGAIIEVGAGERLEELPTKVERRGLFDRERDLGLAGPAIEPPVLAVVLARLVDQRKAKLAEEDEIALDGLLVNAMLVGQFAQRGPAAASGKGSQQGPVTKDGWLIGQDRRRGNTKDLKRCGNMLARG